MTVKTSYNRFPIDSLLVLRDTAQSDMTSTASTDALTLDVLSAYWNTGDVANDFDFAIVVNVSKWDHTTGDETYVLTVEVDDDAAFGSASTIYTVSVTGTGRYLIPVLREQIAAVITSSNTTGYLRLKATLGGTTPILNFDAYVAPEVP